MVTYRGFKIDVGIFVTKHKLTESPTPRNIREVSLAFI